MIREITLMIQQNLPESRLLVSLLLYVSMHTSIRV